jgi:hypothetical protein
MAFCTVSAKLAKRGTHETELGRGVATGAWRIMAWLLPLVMNAINLQKKSNLNLEKYACDRKIQYTQHNKHETGKQQRHQNP